jgi:GntR family histidine utilization transcriptional repressor
MRATTRLAALGVSRMTVNRALRAVPLDEVEHVVDAVIPGREEARLLEIRPTVPCLVLTRRTWSGSSLVTWVRCIHPGPRYRLGARFKARAAHAFA